jgi:hypothetical protein
MREVLGHLHVKGSIVGIEDMLLDFKERQTVLGAAKFKELEERYQ